MIPAPLPTAKVCSRETCPRAGEPQPRSAFRADPRSKDGLQAACHTCERAAARAAYWRSKAPCVRCLERQRVPFSKLCPVCMPTAAEDCQAKGCDAQALPGVRWCEAHRPGSHAKVLTGRHGSGGW